MGLAGDDDVTVDCPHCGAAVSATFQFCGECGQPLARSCPACGVEVPPGFRFCGRCGTALTGGLVGIDRSASVTAEPPFPEERRVVTVIATDLVGSTELATALDPEDLHHTLEPFFDAMADVLTAHGGTVQKYSGDAVISVFGAPVAHADDPVRAVRAGLAMHHRLEQLNATRPDASKLAIRVGIATGEALTSAADTGLGRATGDAFNLAARLQAAAPVGAVAVDPRTWRDTRHIVQYREAGAPWQLKGFPEPVPVRLATGTAHQEGRYRLPLIGRRDELDLLSVMLRRAIGSGRAHLATVVGPPGIGKSRVTYHFATEVAPTVQEHVRVVTGRCLPYGDGLALWPLAEILRTDLRVRLGEAPEAIAKRAREVLAGRWSPSEDVDLVAVLLASVGLPDVVARRDVASTPAASREIMRWLIGRAWQRYLETLAPDGPLILRVEDIHWGGRELLDVLEYVASAVRRPMLLLCTTRPDLRQRWSGWGSGTNGTWLELGPLDDAETARLLGEHLGGAMPEEIAARLQERVEGNPFFAEQLVQVLREEGALVQSADGRWRVERTLRERLPDTVQAAIGARLDLLDPDQRAVVLYAAVIGRIWWAGAVANLANRAVDTDIGRLIEAGMAIEQGESEITGERQLLFQHALTREVAYARIPRGTRRHLHGEVGRWIEERSRGREGEFAEILAYHYELAGEHAPAARFALLAGEYKLGVYSAEEAVRWFDRAEAAIARLGGEATSDLRGTATLRRGAAREQLGEFTGAETDYREALGAAVEAGDPERRAEALAALAHVLWLQDDYGRAEVELDRALVAAGAVNRKDLVGRLSYTAGTIAFGSGRYRNAVEIQRAALAAARDSGDSEVEALALHGLAESLSFAGPLSEALVHVQACSDLVRDLGWLPMLHHNGVHHGWILHWMGRNKEAAEAFSQALDGAMALGDARNAALGQAGRGYVRWQLGDIAGARSDLAQATALAARVGAPRSALACQSHRLELQAEGGDWQGVRATLDRCWEASDAIGGRFFRSVLHAMEGWLALNSDDEDAAQRWFTAAYEIGEETPTEQVWCLRIELRARDGRAGPQRLGELSAALRDAGAENVSALALADYATLAAATTRGAPAPAELLGMVETIVQTLPVNFRWRLWREVSRAREVEGDRRGAAEARRDSRRREAALTWSLLPAGDA